MDKLCGFKLSSIAVIVGWFQLILNVISLTAVGTLCTLDMDRVEYYVKLFIETKLHSELDYPLLPKLFISLVFALLCINIVTSSLLIMGTVKRIHLLLLPWLFNTWIYIFLNIFNLVQSIICAVNTRPELFAMISILIILSLALTFQLVTSLAIYCLYRNLRVVSQYSSSKSNPLYISYKAIKHDN